MRHDWRDQATAQRWDRSVHENNPSRREQLDILVSVLAGLWEPDGWLVDLGCGSGQVEALIFERLPEARVVGIDSSEAMLEIARQRLVGQQRRFQIVTGDLGHLDGLELPPHPYRFAIAVQSLHHLAPTDMRAAYRWVRERLEPGGAFFLLDRVGVENAATLGLLQQVWQRQDRQLGSGVAQHEGATMAAHQRGLSERGDRPVLLQEHLAWLRDAGFDPVCLHMHGHRALIAGTKRPHGAG